MRIDQLEGIFRFLAAYPNLHARTTPFYQFTDQIVKATFLEARSEFEEDYEVSIGEVGSIRLPYEKMGAIDSLDLFGLDELLMFAFYFQHRGNYRRVADIGANLGLHSIILSKCGFLVNAYEPDPKHFIKLVRNLALNGVTNCTPHQKAVSDRDGSMEFIRVLGNTTSNHLKGAKPNAYGELESFPVLITDIRKIAESSDLLKIDAEGHEAKILSAIPEPTWKKVDAFVEVGTYENAQSIFSHFINSEINIFSQKTGWQKVKSLEHLPTSYKEGGVFITAKSQMRWGF